MHYRWRMTDANGSHTGPRIRLLEAEPDLGRFLTSEEMSEARRVTMPVLTMGRGVVDVESRLRAAGAFGAVIVEGVLMHRLVFGDHPALRLLGPGDVLSREGDAGPGPVSHSVYRAPGQLRIALFDDHMLAACQHFPRLFAGLHVRMGEQHQRLAAQLVICQLPRVEDRILGLLWLLAETWGHVTPNGTTLPVALTHDALGECIGARRPTVSLALKALADRGAVLRQKDGWVLLEPLADAPSTPPVRLREGAVTLGMTSLGVWAEEEEEEEEERSRPVPAFDTLRATVATLRETHAQVQNDVRRSLAASQGLRDRNSELREQVATGRRHRRPAP